MTSTPLLQELTGWGPTRDTLHLYCQAVGAVPRALAPSRPNWWHISLKVQANGLVTDQMPRPNGSSFWLRMDLDRHAVLFETDASSSVLVSLTETQTGIEFGSQLLRQLSDLGIEGDFSRGRFENSDRRQYDAAHAERFFNVVSRIDAILKKHRTRLGGSVGPVQLWPHGFDLAFEWFGSRTETSMENGELKEFPSQLNLGFSPGSDQMEPYFYSNPWPFEADTLLRQKLPAGASWHTDGWQGTIFPYAELVNDPAAETRLLDYAQTVFEICSPTLIS